MPIVNLLSAPYFRLRKLIRNQTGLERKRVGAIIHSPEKLNQLLRSSLPVIRADIVDISEVARRRALGFAVWIPEPNNYQNMFTARKEIVARKQLKIMKHRDKTIRRRIWRQAIIGGSHVRGSPRYNYTVGPDRQVYVESGSLSMDLSAVPADPKATRRKAIAIRNAYLSSPGPRTSDYQSAASAIRLALSVKNQSQESDMELSPSTAVELNSKTREKDKARLKSSKAFTPKGPSSQTHRQGITKARQY